MDLNKLEILAEPIIDYIKNQNKPYIRIEIDENGIKVLSTEAFIPKII